MTLTRIIKNYLKFIQAKHTNRMKNKNPDTSALAKYSLENAHCFDFQKSKIIASETGYHKNLILEMLD